MTGYPDFEALPVQVQHLIKDEFEHRQREEFELSCAKCRADLMDGFLSCTEVGKLWDDYIAMQWRDWQRDSDHDAWREFMSELFSPATDTK